jgi:glycosyltransferase involved in cell wall biosynthesis
MKHIVIVGKYFPPEFGGVERYASDVARIAAKTHRVTVVVHNRERDDRIEHRHDNITVVRCGTIKVISSQPVSLSMLAHLRSLQPDLIHFNAPNFWAAAMLSLAGYKAPLIVTHHADVFGRSLLKRAVMPIYHHIARGATCVVVNSFKNAAVSRDLPFDKKCRYVEIPWAVRDTDYALDEDERRALLAERRRRFGNAPTIGFVGRFVRYKALPVLIEALSRLDDAHALLIGDGPLRGQIEQLVRAAGIADRVHFLGNVDERSKVRALAMMDMLTLPSNDTTEAFGLAQVEAQLMGLPVVASRLSTGVTDVTLDNITGLLVAPNDPIALASAFLRLIADPALAHRLGAAGRERALRLFNMKVFEDRWSELFNAVLTGRPFDDRMLPVLAASRLGDVGA